MAAMVIKTEKLTRKFADLVAVDSVSIDIEKGELFGLLGPNGAGKTTLLKLLTGQMEASSGRATVLGADPSKEALRVKSIIGIVPEVESPPTFLTATEYLQYICLVRDIDDADGRVKRWLDFMDLLEMRNTMSKDLSKGTKQKLMIAAAFIHEPPLVFLDEPFAGLDPYFQKKVREYILEYLKGGGTVFMCTHILEIAEKMCTSVAVIDRGRIATSGTIAELEKNGETLDAVFLKYTRGQ
jgi:ABC-2 type transport system ATP-binding protein